MTEWVTWIDCPRCGAPAAVGWRTRTRADGAAAGEIPVEFDCSVGCRLDAGELVEVFRTSG